MTLVIEPTHRAIAPAGAEPHYERDELVFAVNGFLSGYRGATRAAYTLDLKQWLAWCADAGLDVLHDVKRPHIQTYMLWGLEVRHLSPKTVSRRVSTVCGFYGWCEDEEVIHKSPGARVKRPKVSSEGKTPGLDRTQLGTVLIHAGLLGGVHQALCELLAMSGMRISEALNADIANLGQERGHRTLFITRKGGNEETIPLAPRVARAIDLYLGERIEGPLFVDADGNRLTRDKAAWIVRRVGRAAGVPKLHPHVFRVAAITGVLDAGVSIRETQAFAGHADPRTTMRYDRRRQSLDKHATYVLASFVATAAG